MKLIPRDLRVTELSKIGIPKVFIENVGKINELIYRVEDVDSAYFYLPQISNYKILESFNVVPIFDEGEIFCVFIYNENIKKIIRFSLENDSIYKDYDLNWNMLLLDIMFQYFEDQIDNDLFLEKFTDIGKQIGFEYSETLFHLLNIPIEDYNDKYENAELWKQEIAEKLKIV